jgi:cytochrome c oxidase cbb3-type subunit 3
MSATRIDEPPPVTSSRNAPPSWWYGILYGSFAVAIGAYFHYRVFTSGETPSHFYQRTYGTVTAAELVSLSHDGTTVNDGRAIFARTCVTCHGPAAGGLVGPNLTDAYWLHGGDPEAIYRSVAHGYAAAGMPEWAPQLGADGVSSVVAFVLTLRDTNVPGGRPPQGQREP